MTQATESNVGRLVRVSLTNDDNGQEVLRAFVDFDYGNSPDLPLAVIWNGQPVKIVLAVGEQTQESNK